MGKFVRVGLVLGVLAVCGVMRAADVTNGVEVKKKVVAVLPFLGGDAGEKKLAERMRFAVSQKISNDAKGGATAGLERMDNVQVEQVISALQMVWDSGDFPSDDDLQKVIGALEADETIAGTVKGRTLTLRLYNGTVLAKTASVEIPDDKTSPKAAVEKVIGELTGASFAVLRQVEADHSDAAAEKRFSERANLVVNPGFEEGGKEWHVILGSDDYAPPLMTADAAKGLGKDRAAVVPKVVAGVAGDEVGNCLMMRMSKGVAESNGLACVSTWIDVEQGKKYRFTVKYHSEGPVARLFLKGFAYKADQFGEKTDVEAVRREYYRAQVLPREKNKGWDLIEMDITPESLKPTDPKVEWMRLDLWVYLKPGDIFFDDVVLKKLSE